MTSIAGIAFQEEPAELFTIATQTAPALGFTDPLTAYIEVPTDFLGLKIPARSLVRDVLISDFAVALGVHYHEVIPPSDGVGLTMADGTIQRLPGDFGRIVLQYYLDRQDRGNLVILASNTSDAPVDFALPVIGGEGKQPPVKIEIPPGTAVHFASDGKQVTGEWSFRLRWGETTISIPSGPITVKGASIRGDLISLDLARPVYLFGTRYDPSRWPLLLNSTATQVLSFGVEVGEEARTELFGNWSVRLKNVSAQITRTAAGALAEINWVRTEASSPDIPNIRYLKESSPLDLGEDVVRLRFLQDAKGNSSVGVVTTRGQFTIDGSLGQVQNVLSKIWVGYTDLGDSVLLFFEATRGASQEARENFLLKLQRLPTESVRPFLQAFLALRGKDVSLSDVATLRNFIAGMATAMEIQDFFPKTATPDSAGAAVATVAEEQAKEIRVPFQMTLPKTVSGWVGFARANAAATVGVFTLVGSAAANQFEAPDWVKYSLGGAGLGYLLHGVWTAIPATAAATAVGVTTHTLSKRFLQVLRVPEKESETASILLGGVTGMGTAAYVGSKAALKLGLRDAGPLMRAVGPPALAYTFMSQSPYWRGNEDELAPALAKLNGAWGQAGVRSMSVSGVAEAITRFSGDHENARHAAIDVLLLVARAETLSRDAWDAEALNVVRRYGGYNAPKEQAAVFAAIATVTGRNPVVGADATDPALSATLKEDADGFCAFLQKNYAEPVVAPQRKEVEVVAAL